MPETKSMRPIQVDWKKFLYPIILSVIMAGGSAILTSMVWQAKMEMRVEALEEMEEAFEDLETAVNELTNSMEKRDVVEKYENLARDGRLDRIERDCCD